MVEQLAGTMFDAAGWPEAPQVSPAEQRGLLLESEGGEDREPVEVRYARWRQTPDGQVVYATIEREALRMQRIGFAAIRVKAIAEDLRKVKMSLNNTFLSPLARELFDKHEALRPLIELRGAAKWRKEQAA